MNFKMSSAEPIDKLFLHKKYWGELDSSSSPTKSAYAKKRSIVKTAKSCSREELGSKFLARKSVLLLNQMLKK